MEHIIRRRVIRRKVFGMYCHLAHDLIGQELAHAEVVGRDGRGRVDRGWQGRHAQRWVRDAVSTPPKRERRGVYVGKDRDAVLA